MAVPFSRIKSGRKSDFNYDIIYQSNNYGPFIILEEDDIPGYNRRAVKIKFLNTGSIITTKFEQAMRGRVKDPYAPSAYGVGCLGNASCYDIGHTIWRGMINRCYNTKCEDYPNYGGAGIKVCDKWLCFEYFLQDLPFIDGYDKWIKNPNLYHIDKDYKQQGIPNNQKIYSLETCCFLPAGLNIGISDQTNKNKYVGVEHDHGNLYRVRPRINGHRELIGSFPTAELAAAAYDIYMQRMYGNSYVPQNNIQNITVEDVINNNMHPRKMYKLIDKEGK